MKDPGVFSALPEGIIGAGIAISEFLFVFLILAGLWRLVKLVIAGVSAEISPRPALSRGQQLPLRHRLMVGNESELS